MAVAASVCLILGGALWLALHRNHSAWQVSALAGAPQVATSGRRGESLDHGIPGSRAKRDASVGEVDVEPNSQLSVVTLGKKTEQRLDLKRGRISAMIWAPPGQFFVNTPSAVTVDLGCAYTLEVDASGVGSVRVTAGWVAFESEGKELFIPATAACVTRPAGVPAFLTTKMERRDCGARSAGSIRAATRMRCSRSWLRLAPAMRSLCGICCGESRLTAAGPCSIAWRN